MRLSSSGFTQQPEEGEKKCLNSELWHACAGPLVSLPPIGSRVVYFPQGHSEQVAASTNKEVDSQIPNYPSLSPQLICQLHNITMHADVETDEVYSQMTLKPLSSQEQKDSLYLLPQELGTASKQPTNYFCKTLTASDTSTHGGFSVPRRAAEKVFPPLDYSQQPPAQELIARDLHDNEWKFRHVFRGQPKRHLLTTGWSVFVSAKRLVAGDSVLFIWNEKNQLFLGIRRANRPQTVMPSSVLSSDSMHIGLLAAAAHAASTNSRFTIFYNPRASPCEFVIPLGKYIKAVYQSRVSVGMRFRMLFETEESTVRRYMGTITGIGDLDPVRWPNSHWRSVKVGWDESTAGERQPRVSLWEIEPLTTFPMYPSSFPLRLKRPWPSGLPSLHDGDMSMNSPLMWLGGGLGDQGIQPFNTGFNINPWMQPRLNSPGSSLQPDVYQAMAAAALQEMRPITNFQTPFQMPTGFGDNNNPQAALAQAQLLQQYLQRQQQEQQIQQHNQVHVQNPGMGPSRMSPLPHTFPDRVGTTDNISISGSMSNDRPLPQLLSVSVSTSVMSSPPPPHTEIANSLPPFPGREFSAYHHSGADPQSSVLFGVNIDSSPFMMQNGSSSLSVPFGSDFAADADFSLASEMTTSSCVDESGFLPSSGHEDQANPASGNFVKVQKLGSLGRSVDISKFSSYPELRSELAQMFGLEGQLEDPRRSGWQLVFIDRENDVLLLGDDPWQEFVDNVWYIKILSPLEVQQLGKEGINPTRTRKLCNGNNGSIINH